MSGDAPVARAQVALERVGRRRAIGERAGLLGERLFEAGDLLLARPRLALGVGDHERAPVSRASSWASFFEGLGVALHGLASRASLLADRPCLLRPGRWFRRRCACGWRSTRRWRASVAMSLMTAETTPTRYTADGTHRVTLLFC